MGWKKQTREFCGTYLRTMDPERAARAAGYEDGYAALARKNTRRRLERMRETASEIRREDVLRRLAQLAFGQVNDAARLALAPRETDPAELDLSAVSEFKVTDKGGVEIKLTDRAKALATLWELLGDQDGGGAEALCGALEEAAAVRLEEENDGE